MKGAMKTWRKAPETLIKRFNSLLPQHPDAEPRLMFGYAACFVKGNFWMGLHQDDVVVRLPDGLEKRFDALNGAAPFDPMGGRPMKAWFVVPKAVVASDDALGRLMQATFAAVQKLPGKVKAPKAAKAKAAKAKAKKPAKR